MKKAIMLACAMAMALSMAGCGGNEAEQQETQQQETQQETQQTEEEEKEETSAEGVDKQAVYDYLNSLIQSEDNPAARETIGFEDMDINSDEAKQIIQAWQEECEAYDEKCTQETAEKFGITTEEVDAIFFELLE